MPVFPVEAMYLLLMNLCLTTVMDYTDLPPWFTPELPQLKGKGRRLERLCRKTGFAVCKSPYNQQMCHYKDAPSAAKSESSPTLIRCSKGNSFVL